MSNTRLAILHATITMHADRAAGLYAAARDAMATGRKSDAIMFQTYAAEQSQHARTVAFLAFLHMHAKA